MPVEHFEDLLNRDTAVDASVIESIPKQATDESLIRPPSLFDFDSLTLHHHQRLPQHLDKVAERELNPNYFRT